MRSRVRAFVLVWLTLVAAGMLSAVTVALVFADARAHLIAAVALCSLALLTWGVRRSRSR